LSGYGSLMTVSAYSEAFTADITALCHVTTLLASYRTSLLPLYSYSPESVSRALLPLSVSDVPFIVSIIYRHQIVRGLSCM
jgi:hypothetical protein